MSVFSFGKDRCTKSIVRWTGQKQQSTSLAKGGFYVWAKVMKINNEQIEQYMAIYLEEYGHPIDKVRACDELTALVCLLEAVYKFNNKINYE